MIRQAPFYWLECDRCDNREPPLDADHVAWSERAQARDSASDMGWMFKYDKGVVVQDLCPACVMQLEGVWDE